MDLLEKHLSQKLHWPFLYSVKTQLPKNEKDIKLSKKIQRLRLKLKKVEEQIEKARRKYPETVRNSGKSAQANDAPF